MPRTLEATLQALYDSEINVTITTLWDGGYDYALVSYMEEPDHIEWKHAKTAAELADALHDLVMKQYPESDYAKANRVQVS